MKKRSMVIMALSLLVVLALLLSACPSSKPTEAIELSLATMFPPQALEGQVADRFAEKIAEETNGLLTIRVYAVNTLLVAPELIDGVKAGVADMSFGLVYKPEGLEISAALPFILTAPDAYSAGEILAGIFEQFPDQMNKEWGGVKLISAGTTVPQYFFFREKKVESSADLKGLQIRVPSAELGKMVDLIGGTSAYMSSADMAVALEKGTVDGNTGQIAVVLAYKLEMLKYCLKVRNGSWGVPAPNFLIMNQDTWNNLDPYYQKAIDDNREWVNQLTMDLWTQAEENATAYMEEYGAEFYYLSPEEEAKWLAIRDQVQDEAMKALDEKGIPGTEVLQYIKIREYIIHLPLWFSIWYR
jgi:TRAP-type C4-dicarboxylate transport system substrate-binding protein